MVYSTHMIFADEIYKSIDYELKLKLKKGSFKYGNVRPDISRLAINIPHTINESFLYVINEINQLISDVTNTRQMGSREFARRLGVINHYLADYFCLAHNKNIMDEGLVRHIIYEIKINKMCKEDRKTGNNRNLENNDFLKSGCTNIEEYILYKHSHYLEEERNIKVDISYAMQTCITVSTEIIKMCEQKCKRKAA